MVVPGKSTGLLLEQARVITLDPNKPRAEAVLLRNGVIEAVGTNDELEELFQEGDSRFDCGELTLIPAFFDSHSHFLAMGLSALRVDLSTIGDRGDLLAALGERAEDTPEGEWVFGVDFDESQWAGDQTLPSREELDREVSDSHPVVARRVCGHIAVANTMALDAIGETWEDVDRDTGTLLEEVVLRLSEVVGVSDEDAKDAIAHATKKAHENGVTAVMDMADAKTLATYMGLELKGKMGVRVFCAVQARDLRAIRAAGIEADREAGKGMLNVLGIKAFLDGSLGARTAALQEPYYDDPSDKENRGMLLFTDEELERLVAEAEEAGYQLFLHAIGDRAVEQALDAIEAKGTPGNPHRHRIEHLEVMTEELLDRMKELRVVASMQPNFIVQWSGPGGMNEKRLGPKRGAGSEGLRDVWSRGIPLAFGSDCMPFGPLYGLQGAIHHPVEEQSLPPMVALRAYTEGSAWAAHADDQLGSIEVGKLADVVLLDQDPEESTDLRDVKVVMTILGGYMVHVDSEAFNDAVSIKAQQALEEALMDMDLSQLDLDGPREEDEEDG
jgi:predicted amidohydrolase YtcJ